MCECVYLSPWECLRVYVAFVPKLVPTSVCGLVSLFMIVHFHLHLLNDSLILSAVALQLLLVLNPIHIVDNHLLLRVHDLLCIHSGLWWVTHLLQMHFLASRCALSFSLACYCALMSINVRGGLTLRSACDGNGGLRSTAGELLLGCSCHA